MPKNFSQKGFTKNFLDLMKQEEKNKECCLDFLTQVYTENSATVLFTGLGTKNSPLIATAIGGGSSSGLTLVEGQGIELASANHVTTITNRLNWFFVKQYGAVGDGVTDDTAAIQACFTAAGEALPGGGAVVYFDPGVYKITSSITWPDSPIWALGCGVTYTAGSGNATTQIVMDSPILSAFIINGNACKITDIYFYQIGGAATAGAAILSGGYRLLVRDCSFEGYWNGIEQTKQLSSVIDHCNFYNQVNHCIDTSNSINPDNGDGLILGCTFSSDSVATAAGFFQNGSGGQKISNCKFVSGDILMINCIQCVFGVNTSSSDLIISNCSLEQYTGTGILVDVTSGGEFYNVEIVGCNISSYNAGVGISAIGTGGNLFGLSISGNSFSNNTTDISLTDVDRVSISGVIFNASSSNNISQAGTNTNIFYDKKFIGWYDPVAGDTLQLSKWTFIGINLSTPVATLTLNLPSNPLHGDEVEYSLENTVTTLTFTGGIVEGPTSNQVGYRKLKYNVPTTSWF